MPSYSGQVLPVYISRTPEGTQDRIRFLFDDLFIGLVLITDNGQVEVDSNNSPLDVRTLTAPYQGKEIARIFPTMESGFPAILLTGSTREELRPGFSLLPNFESYPIYVPLDDASSNEIFYFKEAIAFNAGFHLLDNEGTISTNAETLLIYLEATPSQTGQAQALAWDYSYVQRIRAGIDAGQEMYVINNPGQADTDGFTQFNSNSLIFPTDVSSNREVRRNGTFKCTIDRYRGEQFNTTQITQGDTQFTFRGQPAARVLEGITSGLPLGEFEKHDIHLDNQDYVIERFEHLKGNDYKVRLRRTLP